jgi:ATP-dependent helicase/nuclease subunit B
MPDSYAQSTIDRELWTELELLETIRDHATSIVVTGNARAARALRQRYNQWQYSSGRSGWRTAGIFGWDAWLEDMWEAAAIRGIEVRSLLNDAQEAEIWRSVLEEDADARQTIFIGSLAESAQKAWAEMQRFNVPLKTLRNDSSMDARAFARWAADFEMRCRKSAFLSTSQLETAAVGWVSNGFSLPEEVLLTGFDRVSPAQTILLEALRAGGCRIRQIALRQPVDSVASPAIVVARTQTEEAEAAAYWIRGTLLTNPLHRIGIIVPSLAESRASMDAAFRRILAPSSFEVGAPHPLLPYEFSLGTPMRLVPEIRAALSLLRWMYEPLPPEEVSWLLVHGDFSDSRADASADRDQDAANRAKLDHRFRDRKIQLGGPLAFSAFRQWLIHENNDNESASLRRTLQHISTALQDGTIKKTRRFADWRQTVEELLAAAKWRLLNPVVSRDFQLLARWDALLDKLSSLNAVTGAVKFDVALGRLEQLASQTLFSLESRNAPVQILGVPESAGLLFDAVWWMGARSSEWPSTGRAQPFLPWSVQSQAGMPHANPQEDYAFALQVTRRILSSGKFVVASFAQETADGDDATTHSPDREVLVSPLLRELLREIPIADAVDFVPSFAAALRQTCIADMDEVLDELPAPFQSKSIRGGVAFLEHQAACPFRAFAELRLAGQPLAGFDDGLSLRDQGTVMHRALQQFWDNVKSQHSLLTRTDDDLHRTLHESVASALAGFSKAASEPWQHALLEIEANRIEERLMQWMEREKNRPAFEVIATESALKSSELGGVEFDCRIDRIDKVPQGIVLIDYKTGDANRASCVGDRPDKPQLPAYAVLRNTTPDEPLAALAFARLQPQKLDFAIVGSVPSVLQRQNNSQEEEPSATASKADVRAKQKADPAALSSEELQAQLGQWRQTLTRLAEDFRGGVAVVDPKKGHETCRFCAQGLLCRIQETGSVAAELAEDDSEDNSSDGLALTEFSRP